MLKFNSRWLVMMLASVSMFVLSCKDDEEAAKNNAFTYDGKSELKVKSAVAYIESAGFSNPGSTTKLYYSDIALLGEDFTLESDGDVTGVGDAILFRIVTSSTEIASGTYSLNLNGNSYKASDLVGAVLFFNYNPDTETGEQLEESTTGKLTIGKSGDTYTIEYEGVVNGKPAKAYYKGSITTFAD
jgi:hypothetical protein